MAEIPSQEMHPADSIGGAADQAEVDAILESASKAATGVVSEMADSPIPNAATNSFSTPSNDPPNEEGVNQADIEVLMQASQLGEDGPSVGGATVQDEHFASARPASARSPMSSPSVPLPEFSDSLVYAEGKRVSMLSDVNLRVKIELGRTRMLVEDVLKLGEGSVVELDKLAGDPVDVIVNERLIARGEVIVLNDNFCVRISEVLSHDPHRVVT